MNFFESQAKARRSTIQLVVLFSLAILSLVLITNILVVGILFFLSDQVHPEVNFEVLSHFLTPSQYFGISLVVIQIIGVGSLAKIVELARGGKYIAEELGGRRINPNTIDVDERKLLNVVEEMAIASGTPAPPVYLMEEVGINAFAAGLNPRDAVIGITRGCIVELNRDQLQGVIAHEFSHIHNGDMRLNIRLIGILHGILFLGQTGETILRPYDDGESRLRFRLGRNSSGKGAAAILMLGMGLCVIGALGSFFGGLIKAAVSRQREFLADASAVQFTRNPEGIGEALKIIGGYEAGSGIKSPRANEVSHLFFSNALSGSFNMFSTHPPIEERISRILPRWNGTLERRSIRASNNNFPLKHLPPVKYPSGAASAFTEESIASNLSNSTERDYLTEPTSPTESIADDVNYARRLMHKIPKELHAASHEPYSAQALVMAILIDKIPNKRPKQFELLNKQLSAELLAELHRLLQAIDQAPDEIRLPLVELALPALKMLSKNQYAEFKQQLLFIAKADDQIDLFEWCLYRMVTHYLAPSLEGRKNATPRYSKMQEIEKPLQIILSTLAHHGHEDLTLAEKAFNVSANMSGVYTLSFLPKEKCTIREFSSALTILEYVYPLLKPRIMKALAQCAGYDKQVTVVEAELLQTIAILIDCPMAPVQLNKELAGAKNSAQQI